MTTITTEDTTDSAQEEEPLHGPNIILDVENFGPIAEAKGIEFRPMTVFVGPSNTGKSYLAMLLHAILKAKHGDIFDSRVNQPTVADDERFVHSFDPTEFMSDVRLQIESGSMMDGVNGRPYIPGEALSHGTNEVMVNSFGPWLNSLSERIESSIQQYFGVDATDQITRLGSSRRNLAISISDTSHAWKSKVLSKETDCEFADLDLPLTRLVSSLRSFEDSSRSLERRRRFRESIALLDLMVSDQLDSFQFSAYLPASRAGIVASQAILAEAIVASADSLGIDGREVKQFNPIARELLRMLIRETRPHRGVLRRGLTSLREIVNAFEEHLLNGEILDRGKGNLKEVVSFAMRDLEIPIDNASSMVNEVAPIVILLQKVLRIGDVIIIDEPESHMHPRAQQVMTAVLAIMVRRGFRVLIATHSHYVVEQLGAFVNAGADSVEPEERARYLRLLGRETDSDLYLKQDEVAVYEFEHRCETDSASEVRELQFDADAYGYYPGQYSSALAAQRNRNMHMVGTRLGF